MDSVTHLGEFIRQEMAQRHLSARGFADLLGVTHATINRFLDYRQRDTGYPSMEFLIKLANATQKDVRYLITLIVPPEMLMQDQIAPELIDLSTRIGKLSPEYRKIIEAIVALGLDSEHDD